MNAISKLRDLLLDSELLDALKSKIDNSINIFDVLKVADAEIRHSNMLAWLLDPNANHGLGDRILKCLINWYADEYISTPDEAVELLMTNNYSFNIRREWRNIDIVLISTEAKVIFTIENKVYSSERDGQLEKYKDIVEQQFTGYKHYFLYLTLEGDESSIPEIWHSVGYEKIIDWTELSLESSLRPEVKQLIEQYITVLRRKVMGYPQEIIDLCNKIYQKHKEAIDLIQEVTISDNSDFSDFEIWAKEWEEGGHIAQAFIERDRLVFRTAELDKLFPTGGNDIWPCYYMVLRLPFPNRLTIEFTSAGLDKKYYDRFLEVKALLKPKELKDNWQHHRIKTWKLHEYDPDQTEDFMTVADDLKAELERLIICEIPKFEADIRNIMHN